MSGRRCKALRRAFQARYGRPVENAAWKQAGNAFTRHWSVVQSEWRRLKRGMIPVAIAILGFLWTATPSWADQCRDDKGRFVPCPVEQPVNLGDPEPAPEPSPTPPPPPAPQRIRVRAMGGALTSLATDVEAAVEPLAQLSIEAPLSTSARGPSLEVQADLTALPGETVVLGDAETFKALEFTVGLSQPIHPAVLFRVYVDGGFASRLATTREPVSRLPGFWSIGLLFRTANRDHSLKLGMGGDERLSGDWAAAITISGRAKVGERAGVSLYLTGSLIRALDLGPYYQTPSRDSLRIGIGVGK